jgi:TatD DNase family protein
VITDSHAHLDHAEDHGDLEAVLERARAAGVSRILTVSSRLGDASRIVRLAERLDATWAAIGVHPHEAQGYGDAEEEDLRRLASRPTVVALGEMGLDYHYDHSPRDVQREVFRRQLRLAREVRLPIVIHSREAEEDTARILEDEGAAEVGGVLHCFTSSAWLAERALALGLHVSFSGIVTFPSAAALGEVAANVPIERLLVETDAPYLAPVPHRGRRNEPAFVRATAEHVATLRGMSLEALAAATNANFDRAFPKVRPTEQRHPGTSC